MGGLLLLEKDQSGCSCYVAAQIFRQRRMVTSHFISGHRRARFPKTLRRIEIWGVMRMASLVDASLVKVKVIYV
jgi:hypothetical protein